MGTTCVSRAFLAALPLLLLLALSPPSRAVSYQRVSVHQRGVSYGLSSNGNSVTQTTRYSSSPIPHFGRNRGAVHPFFAQQQHHHQDSGYHSRRVVHPEPSRSRKNKVSRKEKNYHVPPPPEPQADKPPKSWGSSKDFRSDPNCNR
jgi:hypothetical protein